MSQEPKKILGIETSCDETAVSMIEGNGNNVKVLSNIVSSQIEIHKKYGGVVPEVAAREHVLNIIPVLNEALDKAEINRSNITKEIQAVAVTSGPGLITSLIAGIETAKTLSFAWGIPIIGVNHIEGHIYANFIRKEVDIDIEFPAVVLTVSGGHTMLLLMRDYGDYKTLGMSRDDAAGEAFDKAAKLMDLGYPGGPAVSKKAEEYISAYGEPEWNTLVLPRPMMNTSDHDFSFSGLKTSLLYQLQRDTKWREKVSYYCYEFQQAIVDVLIAKTVRAAKEYGVKSVMIVGGVTANKKLRQDMDNAAREKLRGVNLFIPSLEFTTDNAAMVAAAGYFRAKEGRFDTIEELVPRPDKKL